MKIELTQDEALVLYEFIARNNKKDNFIPLTIDQAEERVLWNLECVFEKVLGEPFLKNYNELLLHARDKLRDKQ